MKQSVAVFAALVLTSAACAKKDDGAATMSDASKTQSTSAALPAASAINMTPKCTDYITESEVSDLVLQPSKYEHSESGCVIVPASGDHSGLRISYRVSDKATTWTVATGMGRAEPISGLGDQAAWVASVPQTGMLVAKKGTNTLGVIPLWPGKQTNARDEATAVARKVLTKM